MDEIVKAAMKKWPSVPACYGWLALDARGDWYMRDERIQAAGEFPKVKGSRIEHDKLREFIARNYAADAHGRWYFQNGPQQVFVELEATPWIWRLGPVQTDTAGVETPGLETPAQPTLRTHTGLAAVLRSTWMDEEGHLYIDTDLGLGRVHTQDMELAANALIEGVWPLPQTLLAAELPQRFGYCLRPAA
jgi:Protein of unknown function (DUF2946)